MSLEGTKVSRRDLLKLRFSDSDSWGKERTTLQEQNPQTIEEVNAQVEKALFDNLGLSPEQGQLTFAFGDHFFTESILEKTGKRDFQVICGEITDTYLRKILTGEIPETSFIDEIRKRKRDSEESKDILIESFSAHPKKARKSEEFIEKLLNSGVIIVATDSNPGIIQGEEIETEAKEEVIDKKNESAFPDYLLPILIAYNLYRHRHTFMTRRRLLALAGLSALGFGISKIYSYAPFIFERPVDDSSYIPNIDDYFMQKVSEEKKRIKYKAKDSDRFFADIPWATFTERLIFLRNIIMALNTWHTVDSVRESEGKTDYLFVAGNGHSGAARKFLEGFDSCSEELKGFAEYICGEYLDLVINQIDVLNRGRYLDFDIDQIDKLNRDFNLSQITDSTIIFLIQYIAQFFSDPYLFANRSQLKGTETGHNIPTAHTVFLKALRSQIEKCSAERKERKKRILLQALFQVFLDDAYRIFESERVQKVFFKDKRKGITIYDETLYQRFEEENVYGFTKNLMEEDRRAAKGDYSIPFVGKGNQYRLHSCAWFPEAGYISLGSSIQIDGMYYPCVRRIRKNGENTLIVEDGVFMGGGVDKIGKKFTATKVNDISTIPETFNVALFERYPTPEPGKFYFINDGILGKITLWRVTKNEIEKGEKQKGSWYKMSEQSDDPLGINYIFIQE